MQEYPRWGTRIGVGDPLGDQAAGPPEDGEASAPPRRRAAIVLHELAPLARSVPWYDIISAKLGARTEVTEVRVRSFEDATTAARSAAASGVDLVIAIGGDGTANACMNGIGDARTRLAVVPAGTANDLARTVGQSADPERLVLWEPRELDAIAMNGLRFYSVGGLGWVARVAETANRWRSGGGLRRWLLARIGSLLYGAACVFVILFGRRLGAPYRVRYQTAADDQVYDVELRAFGLLMANFGSVGGTFKLSRDSSPTDGVFELIVFPESDRRFLLRCALAAVRGRLLEVEGVECARVTRVQVETPRPTEFFAEGETLAVGRRFELELADNPLRMLAPARPREDQEAEPTPPAELPRLDGRGTVTWAPLRLDDLARRPRRGGGTA